MFDIIFHIFFYLGFVVLLVGSGYLFYSYLKIQREIRSLEKKHEQD